MPLAPELSAALRRLLAQPLQPPEALRAQVLAHLQRAHDAVARDPFVDGARAEQVGAGCLALLDAWDVTPASQRALVQAACLYFAQEDDDEDDFASMVGFEDDAELFNHVVAELGRDALSLDLE
ncbi:MAG: hypothetical protein H6741_21695 [Alphaproteobacteria bacterium]|nr:hypothetical protein [Alphaproteobacteria bacterium]